MPLSILIVNWNSREALKRCLTSLQDCPAPILVVDNASEDGSAALVAREFPGVSLLRERTNLGFAGAINKAARHVAGHDLLILNSDVEATRLAVSELTRFLEVHPSCGAVTGALHDDAGRPQRGFNVRRLPTLASFAADLLLVDQIWPNNPASRRYFARDLRTDQPTEVEQPAGACLLVRRAAFDALGGMDERFHPAWFEDVDLCRRLREQGWRIFFVPSAVFLHRGGLAMRALGLESFSLIWYHNLERYVRKHHGLAAFALIKMLIALGMIERLIVSAIRGDREGLAAYFSVLRGSLTGWPSHPSALPSSASQ